MLFGRERAFALMIPAVTYGVMMLGQRFPNTERVDAGVSTRDMFREALRPMFLLLFVCMWMTTCTELGPDQWVAPLITSLTGMSGILILVFTAGIMFVLRNFAGGKLARLFSPIGLLTRVAPAVGLDRLPAYVDRAGSFPGSSTLDIGWGPDLLVPHAVPHRPTSIFRLGLARRRGSQTL